MSVASPRSEAGQNAAEIDYKFCNECANLLYPREDRQLNKLLYVCKACNSSEENEPACTYRQDLSEGAQESMGEKAFVAHDPTLPHEKRACPKCHNEDVVYFQSQQRANDTGMSLFYVCTNNACNNAWSGAVKKKTTT